MPERESAEDCTKGINMDSDAIMMLAFLAILITAAVGLTGLEIRHDRRRMNRMSIGEQERMLSLTATFFARKQNQRRKP